METNYYPIIISQADGSSFTITNSGTAPAPCVLTIIPNYDFMEITITGLSNEPLKVNKIKMNEILVIDGENKTITINNNDAYDHFNGWEFPRLLPGENVVSISNANNATISVEFNARYL